ncbi:MAG TPA: hypothetical protein VEC11_06390 [Allosphingosinicella sp.]|nr:hypothetical protein [Allosphingosinicella sp.]
MDYTHLKNLISQYTGLEKDALHIHAALFIYILAALLFRRSPRSPLPWLIVFGIELANEAHDFWENWGAPLSWALGEGVKDLWNTMLWPTVLLLGGRYGRLLLPSAAAGDAAPPAGTETGVHMPAPDPEADGRPGGG